MCARFQVLVVLVLFLEFVGRAGQGPCSIRFPFSPRAVETYALRTRRGVAQSNKCGPRMRASLTPGSLPTNDLSLKGNVGPH